jgi:hypothetical protein
LQRSLQVLLIPMYIKRACSANQSACFHPIKNVYRDKNVLLLCHLSKVIKIACYSCQILKLFLIIVFLITVLSINNYLTLKFVFWNWSLFTLTSSGIFPFFLARQPQGVLLHRFPPVKPCANENFPYPLVILRLGATLTRP